MLALWNSVLAHPTIMTECLRPQGDTIYYHSGGRYFRKCLERQLSNEYKAMTVAKGQGRPLLAALSSSLYYWYWITVSDTFHVTKKDVETFPVPRSLAKSEALRSLASDLLRDLEENADVRKRHRKDGTIQSEVNYRVGRSMHLIDQIDVELAGLFELDAKQLDFVLNYDRKYRVADTDT
jgi:hypothetical protein